MTVNHKVHRPTRVEKIDGVSLNSKVSSSPNEINQEFPPTNPFSKDGENERRIRKKCLGCGNNFTCPPSENSDYCRNCEENRKRYILKDEEHNPKAVKIHKLTGLITHKEPYKVYHKNSPYRGNQCYKLQIVLEREGATENLFIYPNLVPPPIYQVIQENHYIDQRYLLFCSKKAKGWVLHDWRELSNRSDFKKLENYEQKK